MDDPRVLRDPRALRALAHPLRQQILRRLSQEGPATSAILARELGEDRGATSFHLRQLAQYGFVVVDEERSAGRRKFWRVALDDVRIPTTADGGDVVSQLWNESLADLVAFYGRGDPWIEDTELSHSLMRLTQRRAQETRGGVRRAPAPVRAARGGGASGRAARHRALRGLPEPAARVKRRGPLGERLRVSALRTVGVAVWRVGERLGLDPVGATDGPLHRPSPQRRAELDELIDRALAADGVIDAAACPAPAHELLTHLVVERGLLLHGSNDVAIDVLEPRPAIDFGTELDAVVACDDGIWPIFYAVVARPRVEAVYTACVHVGGRRTYVFAIGEDPAATSSWTRGAVYALPRAGFRREWGREWVSSSAVRPVLRVLVRPEDFPLRESVVAMSRGEGFRSFRRRLQAARAVGT